VGAIGKTGVEGEVDPGKGDKKDHGKEADRDRFFGAFFSVELPQEVDAEDASDGESVTCSHYKAEEGDLFQDKEVCEERQKGDCPDERFPA